MNKLAQQLDAKWKHILKTRHGPIMISEHESKEIIDELNRLEARAEGFKKIAAREKAKAQGGK